MAADRIGDFEMRNHRKIQLQTGSTIVSHRIASLAVL